MEARKHLRIDQHTGCAEDNPNYTGQLQSTNAFPTPRMQKLCHQGTVCTAAEVVSCFHSKLRLASGAKGIPVPLCRAGGRSSEKAPKLNK